MGERELRYRDLSLGNASLLAGNSAPDYGSRQRCQHPVRHHTSRWNNMLKAQETFWPGRVDLSTCVGVDQCVCYAAGLGNHLLYFHIWGRYAPEDKREFRSFFSRYLSDIPFRRDVAGAVREYLESAEYLGPNLTAVLRSRQFSLDQSIHIIGSVGEAMLRATSPKWIADSVSVGRRQGIEGSLRGSFRDKTYAWLESNPIPNPWYEH